MEIVQLTNGPLTDVKIQLTRLGVLSGKITNEDGDPIRVNVQILRKIYSKGWHWKVERSARTADDGTYSIGNIAPGRYVLAAVPGVPNPRLGPVGSSLYQTAFYPGVPDASGATWIEVGVEGEVRDANIRLQKRNVYRVSGTAVISAGGPKTPRVDVVSRYGSEAGGLRQVGFVSMKDGTFAIEGIPDGDYYLQVREEVGSALFTSRTPVTVAGKDLENVSIQVSPATVIKVTERTEGTVRAGLGATLLGAPRIRLTPLDAPNYGRLEAPAADGTLALSKVAPGTYRVEGLARTGTYVSSIRYEGQDVTWSPITVENGAGTLEVVYETDGAWLIGVVRDGKGDPVPSAWITIWSTSNPEHFVQTMSDLTGVFHTREDLAPGEYHVAAWDPGATSRSSRVMRYSDGLPTVVTAPEFLKQFETTATTVQLRTGPQAQEVTVTPLAEVEAALARLP